MDCVFYCCGKCRGLYETEEKLENHKTNCTAGTDPDDCQYRAIDCQKTSTQIDDADGRAAGVRRDRTEQLEERSLHIELVKQAVNSIIPSVDHSYISNQHPTMVHHDDDDDTALALYPSDTVDPLHPTSDTAVNSTEEIDSTLTVKSSKCKKNVKTEKPRRRAISPESWAERAKRLTIETTSTGLLQLNVTSYTCDDCGYTCNEVESYMKHRREHNQSALPLLSCDQCSFTTQFKSRLNKHKTCHNKHLMCEFCSYKTGDPLTLKRHTSRHTGEFQYRCSEPGCDYSCRQKHSLHTHLMKHTGEAMKCPESSCSFTTRHKSSLKLHIKRKHTTETRDKVKLFNCAMCQYSTDLKSYYNRHMKKHLGFKDFKCSQCSYTASSKDAIRVHTRIHSNLQIYQCEFCGYRTNYSSALRVHLMVHRDIKPWMCSICDYKSVTRQKVNRHIRQRHKNMDDATAVFVKSESIHISTPSVETSNEEKIVKLGIRYEQSESGNATESTDQCKLLEYEVREDEEICTLQCSLCNFTCHSDSSLTLHQLNFHSNGHIQIVDNDEHFTQF